MRGYEPPDPTERWPYGDPSAIDPLDYSTETQSGEDENETREWDILPPDDTTLTDVPTPEIDVAIIEHEAERIESDHVFTPPEPGPGDAPEGEDGEQDVGRDGEEVVDRFECPVAGAAA